MTQVIRRIGSSCFLLIAFLLVSGPAWADQMAAAEALFQAGVEARNQEDYATACEKFKASNQLDPAVGTLLNLADCNEKQGKTASAWRLYREAVDKLARDDERRAYASERADALEPELARLELQAGFSEQEAVEAGASIYLDGELLPYSVMGVALPLDSGSHEILVVAEGRSDAQTMLEVKAGKEAKAQIELGLLLADGQEATPVETGSRDWKWKAGWSAVGVGAGALVLGGVTGILAIKKNQIVERDCVGDICSSQAGVNAAKSGGTFAAISTGAFIAAGVLEAMGITLLVLSREDAPGREQGPGREQEQSWRMQEPRPSAGLRLRAVPTYLGGQFVLQGSL